jgi:branched-chain amino acid transport system permease protein
MSEVQCLNCSSEFKRLAMIILDILIGGLLTGGIYALLAVGFNLQYGVVRVMNVAHGEFIMLAALSTYSLNVAFGMNPLISLAIFGPLMFILGLLIHKVLFEHLRKVSGSIEMFESRSLLITFGLLFIIQNVALLAWGADIKGYSFLSSPVNLLGAKFAANRLLVLLFALSILLIFYFFLVSTRLGKGIRAATQDMRGAQLIGINIQWMYGLCFGLGALLAGFTGVLMSTMFAVSPAMGFQYTIIAVIVVVLGGLGNILGSLIGGLILGLISSFVLRFEPGLELVVFYILFMIILVLKPKGIFGK